MMLKFDYPEDQAFFERNLCGPGETLRDYADFFDLRPPDVKRREFATICKRVLTVLRQQHGEVCLLQFAPRCDVASGLTVDHLIPLSSNVLNKRLRGMRASHLNDGTRVNPKTQSFGSNHERNLVLACRNCNKFKMNKLLDAPVIKGVRLRMDTTDRLVVGPAKGGE